jgi:uncharacterized protein YraI
LRSLYPNKTGLWFIFILGLVLLLVLGAAGGHAAAQQIAGPTPSATAFKGASGALITVTYIEPINVRTGPSSFDYPIIGTLPVGGTAPAIGRSPAGEWIQIVFPDAPLGTGWVYAANVSLSPGANLPIVEPPPTPVPLETPTLNPTYVAAFQVVPTSTRLPTFTSAPPLTFPTYANTANSSSSRAITTWVIVILGLVGIVGLFFTSVRRH